MISIMDRLTELNKQHREMTESKSQTRDITQEFVLRSKLRDLHNACKVCNLYCKKRCVSLYEIIYTKMRYIMYTICCILGVGSIIRSAKRNRSKTTRIRSIAT